MMTNSQHNVARDFGDVAPLEPNDAIHVKEAFPDAELANGEPVSTIIALPDYLVVFRRDDDDNPEPLINIQKALGLIPNCMFRSGKSQYSLYRLRNPDDRAKLEYITPTGAVLFSIKAEIPVPDNDTEDAYHLIVSNHDGIVAIESDDIEEAAQELGVSWPSLHFRLEAEETGGNSEDVPLNCERTAALVLWQRFGFDGEAIDTVTRKRYDFAEITPREIFRRHPNQVPAARLPDGIIALVSENLASLTAYLEAVQTEPLVTLRNGAKHAALFRKHPAEELTNNPALPADIRLVRPGTLIQLPFGSNLQNCDVQVRAYDKLSEFPFEDLAYPPPEVMELIGSLAAQQNGSVVERSAEDTQERILRNEATQRQQLSQAAVDEVPQAPDEQEAATPSCADNIDSKLPVPANPLQKYSLLGSEDEVARAAVKVVALLGFVILMGQFAMIYAQPNTGKTLLVIALLLQAVEEGRLDPRMLYYVNADDNTAGIIEKLGPFREIGAHTLVPGYKGFEPENLIEMMLAMIKNNQCTGIVVVVDTLKSFIDLMDKKKSAQFGRVGRRFQNAGGTFIGLAHLNKNPGRNGKPIYAGTSDFLEACDVACYLLPVENKEQGDKIVRFELFKKRGGGNRDEAYSFSGADNISYDQLVASVQKIDPDQMHQYARSAQIVADQSVIEGICTVLKNGPMQKMALAKAVASLSKATRRQVIEILERYTGSDPATHKWDFVVAERGAKVFTLHPTSEI